VRSLLLCSRCLEAKQCSKAGALLFDYELRMLFVMGLRGFVGVVLGMQFVGVRHVRVASGRLVITPAPTPSHLKGVFARY
jgi:hypothetical protein